MTSPRRQRVSRGRQFSPRDGVVDGLAEASFCILELVMGACKCQWGGISMPTRFIIITGHRSVVPPDSVVSRNVIGLRSMESAM